MLEEIASVSIPEKHECKTWTVSQKRHRAENHKYQQFFTLRRRNER